MMNNAATNVKVDDAETKTRQHYFETRDFDLAAKVSQLPNAALLSNFEMAAITGIAASSFTKDRQRQIMGLPDPIRVGRLLKWRMADARAWLDGKAVVAVDTTKSSKSSGTGCYARRGRPTKAEQLARQTQTQTQ